MKNSILYNALHFYIKFCSRFYFKKLEIHGLENIPNNGPVIFAGNHQNAFLDAILIHISQPRAPHFLTRGDIFKKPIPNKLLRSLKMRPIYRFRDGISNIKKNKSTFSECYDLLETNMGLGIFPEGNHDLKFTLRPLQKGMARIVYETESRNNFNLNIHIIPVGIQYYGNQFSRSNVLIQYGKALNSKDYSNLKDDEKGYINALTQDLQMAMKPLILHIEPENYDEMVANWKNSRSENFSTLLDVFKNDQKLLSEKGLSRQKEKNKLIFSVLMAPFAAFGVINNFLLYSIFQLLLKKLVSEIEFLGSIKFAVALVFFPIGYLLQTALLYPFIYEWAGFYLLSLPISGIIARDWLNNFIIKTRTKN